MLTGSAGWFWRSRTCNGEADAELEQELRVAGKDIGVGRVRGMNIVLLTVFSNYSRTRGVPGTAGTAIQDRRRACDSLQTFLVVHADATLYLTQRDSVARVMNVSAVERATAFLEHTAHAKAAMMLVVQYYFVEDALPASGFV